MPIRWRLTIFNAPAIGTILLLGIGLFFLLRESLLSRVEKAKGPDRDNIQQDGGNQVEDGKPDLSSAAESGD